MTGQEVDDTATSGQTSRTWPLRAGAVALFAAAVVFGVLTDVLASGLTGVPGITDPQELAQPGVLLFALGCGSAGLLIAWHRPAHPAAWLLLAAADLETLCDLGQAYGARALAPSPSLPGGTWALSLSAPLWIVGIGLLTVVLVMRYPSGRIEGLWRRRVERAVVVGLLVMWVVYAGSDNSVTDVVPGARPPLRLAPAPWLEAAVGLVMAVVLLGGFAFAMVDAVLRTVRSTAPERQQLALLVTSVLVTVAGLFLPWRAGLHLVAQAVPAAVAVGVLRYRMAGIEVVIRRTLLYGVLTGLVLLVMITVTWAVTSVAPAMQGGPLVAAIVLAVAVAPLRDRLQRGVDRFVYGDRTTAWRALDSISSLSSEMPTPERVLKGLAEALRLPSAELWSGHGDPGTDVRLASSSADTEAAASTAAAPGVSFVVPLVVEGRTVASLRVRPRRGEGELPRADKNLLVALAPMLGLLVRSVQLSDLLREEHRRTKDSVAAERDRLRRDLHDGLGPSLTGIGLGLEAVAATAIPPRAEQIVARLRTEVTTCLDDVRQILDDLRPAAPGEHRLLDHACSRAEHLTATSATHVSVDVRQPLPVLPGHVHEGLTRILDEALTNVVRHARARSCTVSFAHADGAVELVVQDDGIGFRGPRPAGIGLPSMHARALALNGALQLTAGGTRLTVRVPLAPEAGQGAARLAADVEEPA